MEDPIWYPYTPLNEKNAPIVIVRGKGAYIYSEKGDKYLDAISSWWVNLHGHGHPYIQKKIHCQMKLVEHVMLAGFTHNPALNLAKRLLSFFPHMRGKVFFSDNGSTSVEVALKIALQYWDIKKEDRKVVVSFKGSYHGDTFGSMGAAGKNPFNRPFWSHLFETISIDPPTSNNNSYEQLEKILKSRKVASFIFEPLILGVGGMIIYPKEPLEACLELCERHKVITIADEVMTGFGRTGTNFASDQLTIKPDIICLSKGITGGFLPLGATLCKEFIWQTFFSHTFYHGHSYTANPLACTSALASLDLLLEKKCYEARDRIATSHRNFCEEAQNHPYFKRCGSLGTILAMEYRDNNAGGYFHPMRDRLYNFFIEKNILLRPLGNVIYVLPPYCITNNELKRIYEHALCFTC